MIAVCVSSLLAMPIYYKLEMLLLRYLHSRVRSQAPIAAPLPSTVQAAQGDLSGLGFKVNNRMLNEGSSSKIPYMSIGNASARSMACKASRS
jgi:hypothetical protein